MQRGRAWRRAVLLVAVVVPGCGDRKETPPAHDPPAAAGSVVAIDAAVPTQRVTFRSESRCEQRLIAVGPATADLNKGGEAWTLNTPPGGLVMITDLARTHQLMLLDGGTPPITVLQRLDLTPAVTDIWVRYDHNGVCTMFPDKPPPP